MIRKRPAEETSETTPMAVSVARAAQLMGLSRSFVWKVIASGRLSTTKVGTRRLVHFSSLRSLLGGGEA